MHRYEQVKERGRKGDAHTCVVVVWGPVQKRGTEKMLISTYTKY